MDLVQLNSSQVQWEEFFFDCAIGKAGFIAEQDKTEGDKRTPCGAYTFLKVYYRADRVKKPQTVLPVFEITGTSAWCDDVSHELYNKYFDLSDLQQNEIPSHEKLWREDHLYDILVVVDHNYTHVKPNKGSAIFIHCVLPNQKPPFKPSLGCLKLQENDLIRVIKECNTSSKWIIPAELVS